MYYQSLFKNKIVHLGIKRLNLTPISMAKVRGTIVVDVQRCKGCNLCVVACPTKVLELHPTEVNDKSYHYSRLKNDEDCIGCASCGMVCPDGVITVYKVKLP